jgi:HSP20 family protein
MLTRWSNFERSFAILDELQRRMNHLFDEFDGGRWPAAYDWRMSTWPPTNLFDNGKELVLLAEVPGLSEKDIQITGNHEMLTLSGERKPDVPERYSVHRQERKAVKFSRSFTFPCKVDLEKTSASVKNGVLTVSLPKAAEAQPKQITVKAE